MHSVTEDIISCRIFENAVEYEIKYKHKKVFLNQNVVPCIFPNLSFYFNKSVKKRTPYDHERPTKKSILPNNLKINPVMKI